MHLESIAHLAACDELERPPMNVHTAIRLREQARVAFLVQAGAAKFGDDHAAFPFAFPTGITIWYCWRHPPQLPWPVESVTTSRPQWSQLNLKTPDNGALAVRGVSVILILRSSWEFGGLRDGAG